MVVLHGCSFANSTSNKLETIICMIQFFSISLIENRMVKCWGVGFFKCGWIAK